MGQTGVAKVPDPRLDLLSVRFQPKKTTPTALEFLDTPGLMPDERRDNPRRLGILRESNGLLVVLNGFSEADPAAQLRRFREELMFADLEIVSGRIGRLEDQLKKPRPAKLKEQDQVELGLLQRIAAAFEAAQSPAARRPQGRRGKGHTQLPAADAEGGVRAARRRRRQNQRVDPAGLADAVADGDTGAGEAGNGAGRPVGRRPADVHAGTSA